MPVHFLDTELSRWDELDRPGDALLLTFFKDERPLRGAAGLADWRLCGKLSRLIRRKRLSGKRGEQLMLPPGRRLPFARVMLFGLGDSRKFDEEIYRQHVRWIRDVAARAKIDRYATQPPGRATGMIGARRALDLWLDEADKAQRNEDVVIIEAHGGQKEMAEILRYRGKRGSA
jgi:hypothetical protein